MKNRGFTLLELLGVIVILALLTTLVFPSVLNAIKKSSNETDRLSMDLISNAADMYIDNHANDFKKRNGNRFIIDMNELMEDGNLPSNIKISDIEDINDKCVQVMYINNKYMYELKDEGACEHFITLPEEYQQVEYIESSGIQYIDTGWHPSSNNAQIKLKYSPTGNIQYTAVCGSENTGYNSRWLFVLYGQSSETEGIYPLVGDDNNISNYFVSSKDTILEIEWIAKDGVSVIKELNTNKKIERSYTSDLTAHVDSLQLFQNLSTQKSSIKLYYFKIHDNDKLVMDFIPCYRKSDGVIGMYDLVEDKFYTNSGTGTFTKGQDI